MEKEKFIMKRAGEKNKIRKMFKNELGITLIALVVTIVILLILAGITINMLLGEGGIIKTAQDAKNTWEGAVTNEQEAIQNLVNELNEVMGGNGEQEEPWVAPNTVKEAIEQDRIFEKTVTIKDEENQNVTVPEGFKVKPDAELVNDGIVIEDEIGNQFVWIPVEDPSWMYGTDENGKKWGKNYLFFQLDSPTGIPTPIEEPVPNGWKETNGVIQITTGLFDVYRGEPDIITKGSVLSDDGTTTIYKENIFDVDPRNLSILGLSTGEEFLAQMEQEFNNMISSVEKYKGFYIGRYETSNFKENEVTNAKVIKGQTSINTTDWYCMYQSSKNIIQGNSEVNSGMIWSCQYDRILQWLVESGDKTYAELADSTTWGNHLDSVGEAQTGCGSYQPTGSNEAWKANNIYDLAGNVYEWTMTKEDYRGTQARIKRGGCAIYTGTTNCVASHNSSTPYDANTTSYKKGMNIGTRAYLCIK